MDLLTIAAEATGTLEDRKSRFLAYLVPIGLFSDRLDVLKKEHRKANHFVTAYRRLIEDDRIDESGKDDGEPAGTSGMPTLRILQGARLIEVGVVVVRYFGGVKLGGGGLARAYSGAAADALNNAALIPFVKYGQKTIEAPFAESSPIERQIIDLGLTVVARNYTPTGVSFTIEGPEDTLRRLN